MYGSRARAREEKVRGPRRASVIRPDVPGSVLNQSLGQSLELTKFKLPPCHYFMKTVFKLQITLDVLAVFILQFITMVDAFTFKCLLQFLTSVFYNFHYRSWDI